MSRRTPCRFHQSPSGCRKGQDCDFLHTAPSGGPSGSPSREAPASVLVTARRRSLPAERAPNGLCNEFWATGQCKRNFECRFKHEPRPTPLIRRSHVPPSVTPRIPPTRRLDPTEVHNHLGKYLKDHYRFTSPNEIYAFVNLIGHATKENNWNIEDGQLLLTTLATPGHNGLLRIGDIVRDPFVTISAGMSLGLVSFQRAYFPLLMYFASEFVVKSAMSHNVNALYALIHNDFEAFANIIKTSMEGFMANKTFQDPRSPIPQSSNSISGGLIFTSLSTVLFEYLTRFRHATATQTALTPLVHSLSDWLDLWISGINSVPPTFEDTWTSTPISKRLSMNQIRDQVRRVVTIVDREQAYYNRQHAAQPTPLKDDSSANVGVVAYLQTSYVGPGSERPGGPRHNNDFTNIMNIRIAPTHEELVCHDPPFLPANFPGAPHPLEVGSMERLLDVQFRLLREELIAPLRKGIQLVLQDLRAASSKKTVLSNLLAKRGGRYTGAVESHDSLMFNVYTNCQFSNFQLHPYRGVTVEMSLDAPPGSARSKNPTVRSNFWEGRGGKRLMQGGLIALIWGSGANPSIYLGVVTGSLKDIALSAKQSRNERVNLQVSFFDPKAELQILEAIKNRNLHSHTLKLLLEAPVMYETIRPFLKALCAEPTSFPFSRYLPHPRSGSLATTDIYPPAYAKDPAFAFDLRCLFKDSPPEILHLNVMDPYSADVCRQELCAPNSRLDASQANAMVDALTREVALIQGPPGTGKTYIGVELIRLLLKNKVGPLLMIAFTNHALDHMLSSVLDAGITNKIVRLGARSSDERISKFNLDNLEMVQGESRLDPTLKSQFRVLKETQKDMDELMSLERTPKATVQEVDTFLQARYPDGYASLQTPPIWVHGLIKDQNSGWRTAGAVSSDDNLYSIWENSSDLRYLKPWKAKTPPSRRDGGGTSNYFIVLNDDTQESSCNEDEPEALNLDKHPIIPYMGPASTWIQNWSDPDGGNTVPKHDAKMTSLEPSEELLLLDETNPTDPTVLQDAFFTQFDLPGRPDVPTTDRPIEGLLISGVDMWGLSEKERTCLSRHWRNEISLFSAQQEIDRFSRLRNNYENARVRYNEIKDQSKARLLNEIDIVGCTTTGAAKFNTLLRSFSPKVLLVEEAGQVLEAHVLGSLVRSVEHLVLIGDPLQLRPNLANYNLSIDSKRGEVLYRFDVSLMERLSSSGLRMSQIEVQRRMRPCIADLIRTSLYPNLQDHELTKQYPIVRGMAKNMFFMSHEHRETGGGEDSVSKHNMFEVKMTVDLVLHFLRQGAYSGDGDIVVLCAYLGQLVRMRDAFAGKVVTVIDERDQETIAAHEEDRDDDPMSVHRESVSRKVLLRTIDNFQGEEAKIIILSLVRNSGSIEDEQEHAASITRPSIGFLKSRNRTNVALSRARHGLYIMGNANDLASKSSMWKTVIDVLDEQGSLGPAFPISCWKHPEEKNFVSVPGMLPLFAPDGGCMKPCAEPLKCGHVCPYKCHSDDEGHRAVSCSQLCTRLCPQGHPCSKLCSEPCGNCCHPVPSVSLPCGHVSASVPCHLVNDLSQVKCRVNVEKSYSTCEHKITLACGVDVTSHKCQTACGTSLVCCGRSCTATCGDCQLLNLPSPGSSRVPRRLHQAHPCQRRLFCGHTCDVACSGDHKCTTRCGKRCRQTCAHASCKQSCHVVCAPCAQPCCWNCPHQGTCPVPCGSICARLPCDIRCSKVLSCGHQCPSLCGEPCSICILCAPSERKKDIVDFIMQTTMEDLVPGDTLDTLIFTLSCQHSFTVETLDGVCELKQFYRCFEGKWLGLATPDPGFRGAPVCPTCRSPITIPRYGRAIRRSALDLAELNVASDMSHSLEEAKRTLDGFNQATVEALIDEVKATPVVLSLSDKDRDKITRMHMRYLQDAPHRPITPQLLSLSGGTKAKNTHHVPRPLAMKWKKMVTHLVRAYSIAVEVVSQRPAHIVAYENAFSTLYQQEMQNFTEDSAHAPCQPTENAMRVARFRVGQPPPRADKRFSVDALWLSLRLRFLMGELAEDILKAMHADVKWSVSIRFVWASYIRFIYLSCCRDVQLARDIAMKSESHRQIVTSRVFHLRAKFELLRFDVGMWRQQEHSQKQRELLLLDTMDWGQVARQLVHQAGEEYLSSRKGVDNHKVDRWAEEDKWITTNLTEPTSKIMVQWSELERSIRDGTFYNPVSHDELTQIVGSFDFSHTGHWYKCLNGHTYVIGECGGAMEEAFCPECGLAIGGIDHNVDPTNTHATDMEDIGRTRGAMPSPWAWGRDA